MNYLKDDNWVSLSGKPIGNIEEHIRKRLGDDRYTFHIGSDSKTYTNHTVVITAICFRELGSGVLVAYQKNKVQNFANITQKLIHEVVVSLEGAQLIQNLTGEAPTVHADVNPDKEALSNRALSVIVGMIKGMGYSVKVKPDAWAADIADMFTR